MPEPNMPQRVALLYRGVRLGAELLALLGEERQVDVINSPIELANGRPPADVVVIDVPAQDRRAACEQVRRHYRGPLIVLLDLGDSSHELPPDHNRTLLIRPLSMRQLSVALAMPAPTQPTSDPAGVLRLVPSDGARTSKTESSPGTRRGMVGQGVLRRVRSWRERRLVRVSAISVTAVLVFMGAFAVVSQGDRCGPGCEELTGTDLTAPSSTVSSAAVVGPDTTDSGAGMVDPTTNDPGVGLTADGGGPVDAASSDGAASTSTSTARSSGAPVPTSRPDPTRPQPTTAPTTTRPRTSTSTSTSASTSTTTTTTTTIATTGP